MGDNVSSDHPEFNQTNRLQEQEEASADRSKMSSTHPPQSSQQCLKLSTATLIIILHAFHTFGVCNDPLTDVKRSREVYSCMSHRSSQIFQVTI